MCGETAQVVPGPFLVRDQKLPIPIMAHLANARLTEHQEVRKYIIFGRLRGVSGVVFGVLLPAHIGPRHLRNKQYL